MVLSSKRAFSDVLSDHTNNGLQMKKNNFGSGNRIPRKPTFKLLKTDGTSEFDSTDYEEQKLSEYELKSFKFKPSSFLNIPFSTNNDSLNNSAIIDQNYEFDSLTQKRKSISRPGSFSCSSRRYVVPKSDLVARERCFDYIVQSIDEVWARYCDTTSCAEAMVYGDWNSSSKKARSSSANNKSRKILSSSYKPLNLSEDDDETEVSENDDSESDFHIKSISCKDDEDDYKSEYTNLTEYETDSSECRTVSTLPDSVKLQSLKCRLTKAKNDLEQYYDSSSYSDCVSFWKRWDMIKYSAVEVMEDDDDDEIVESAIDELEEGRCFIE